MTALQILTRVRCWIPGPTRARLYVNTLAENKQLRDALERAHDRHVQMRTFAYHWRAQLKAAEAAATDAGYDGQSPATVIYTLASQLETARRERDEALRAFRQHIEGEQ